MKFCFNLEIFIQENTFENAIYNMAAILPVLASMCDTLINWLIVS